MVPERKPREQMRAYIKRLKKDPTVPLTHIHQLEAALPIRESDVEKEIFNFLQRLGMEPLKQEVGTTLGLATGMRKKVGGMNKVGVSDLVFFPGRGVTRFCEVKTPDEYAYLMRNWDKIRVHVPRPKVKGKKVSDPKTRFRQQVEFIEKMRGLGHEGFFADSVRRVCVELLKTPHVLTPFQLGEVQRLAALPV